MTTHDPKLVREKILEILKEHTQEMEGYSYFGSNPGVPKDEYPEVADEILGVLQSPPPQQDDREEPWDTEFGEVVKELAESIDAASGIQEAYHKLEDAAFAVINKMNDFSARKAARAAQSEDVDNLKMIIRRVYRKLKIGRPESAIHLLDEAHDMWRGSPLRDESIKSAEGK